MKTLTATAAPSTISSVKILPALSAITLGVAIILSLGFMQDSGNYLHNAAHDGRHSAAFPCH
ncbi:MAG: CbtB-domain containing protein [Methylococcales bacterium]|nr:CbtB-domain containing protein [Methylococcales bacterium]